MTERDSILNVLKENVTQSVTLFFAPVTAVAREFGKVIDMAIKDSPQSHTEVESTPSASQAQRE